MQHLDQRSSTKLSPLVASSPQTEQQRTWLIFANQIEIFQVKAWPATFKATNVNLKLSDDRWKKTKKKNSSIDLRRAFTSASVDRWSISSASVAVGLFPNLSCLVSLICSLLTLASYYPRSLPLSWTKPCLTKLFSGPLEAQRTRPMARQSSVGGCGWLVSDRFWAWIEKKLLFPWPFSKRTMRCACTFGSRAPATFIESAELSCACPIFPREKFSDPTQYESFLRQDPLRLF